MRRVCISSSAVAAQFARQRRCHIAPADRDVPCLRGTRDRGAGRTSALRQWHVVWAAFQSRASAAPSRDRRHVTRANTASMRRCDGTRSSMASACTATSLSASAARSVPTSGWAEPQNAAASPHRSCAMRPTGLMAGDHGPNNGDEVLLVGGGADRLRNRGSNLFLSSAFDTTPPRHGGGFVTARALPQGLLPR